MPAANLGGACMVSIQRDLPEMRTRPCGSLSCSVPQLAGAARDDARRNIDSVMLQQTWLFRRVALPRRKG